MRIHTLALAMLASSGACLAEQQGALLSSVDQNDRAAYQQLIPSSKATELAMVLRDASSDAELNAGIAAFEKGDYRAAYRLLVPAARAGNSGAAYDLGQMFYAGQGVPKNNSRAAFWFRQAAYRNVPEAQYWLGLLNYAGWGLPIDKPQAAFWYEQAAQHGLAYAQANLAGMQLSGDGIPVNLDQGRKWAEMAASQWHENGLFFLWEIHTGMFKKWPADRLQSYVYLRLAEIAGRKGDQDRLSQMKKELSAEDVAKAEAQIASFTGAHRRPESSLPPHLKIREYPNLESLKAQAAAGDPISQFDLARYFESQAPTDWGNVAHWYQQAADQQLPDAQYKLSTLYRSGKGVPKNEAKADALVVAADRGGQPEATLYLSQLYRTGRGVEKDALSADLLLESARLQGADVPTGAAWE